MLGKEDQVCEVGWGQELIIAKFEVGWEWQLSLQRSKPGNG